MNEMDDVAAEEAATEIEIPSYQARFADLQTAIDEVWALVSKGTIVDSKLLVQATLINARSILMVAEQLEGLSDTLSNLEESVHVIAKL